MAPTKLIIDTDPGNDDMLAMLLGFSASPEDLEILMISVTYGNVDAQNCLRNVVTLFHTIEKEMAWRKEQGLPEGFDMLKKHKPLVAVGANAPLGDQRIMADYFHGRDGLADITVTHPHFTPAETWQHLFKKPPPESELTKTAPVVDKPLSSSLFEASREQSWREILRLLKENPEDTISIATIGPMTNLALAAAEDPHTLMRAKEIIVMGGAINTPGNITPLSEFNTFADAHAAARVYALSSPNPHSTSPTHAPGFKKFESGSSSEPEAAPLKDYPPADELGDRRLKIVLFPLDITEKHLVSEPDFDDRAVPLAKRGSPLAQWMQAWVGGTFRKMQSLDPSAKIAMFELHDPMTIWYAMDGYKNPQNWSVKRNLDLRVETAGQWSRGACIIDRRTGRVRYEDDRGDEAPGDDGGWFSDARGNRLGVCVKSPGEKLLSELILRTILAPAA